MSDSAIASKHWDIFGGIRFDDLEHFRRNGLSKGLDDSYPVRSNQECLDGEAGERPLIPKRPDEVATKQIQKAYDELAERVGWEFIEQYHESKIGDPQAIHYHGMDLNYNDIDLIYFAWKIGQIMAGRKPRHIIEIGGGYGGLMRKLLDMYPNAYGEIYDLPEVNTLQRYYLHGSYSVAAKHGKAIADRDRPADLVINTRSFMEMDKPTIAFYFKHIERLTKPGAVFYNVNRIIKQVGDELIKFSEYPYSVDKWVHTEINQYWRSKEGVTMKVEAVAERV